MTSLKNKIEELENISKKYKDEVVQNETKLLIQIMDNNDIKTQNKEMKKKLNT